MTNSETNSNYRIIKKYDNNYQMYFYYPQEKKTVWGIKYWRGLGGHYKLFGDEQRAMEEIKKYDSGKTNLTEYIYL